MPRFTKARDTHRAGRLARDQEAAWEEMRKDLHECLSDPDSDLGDLQAVLAQHLPEEASQIHREVAEDRRGIVRWAKDRRERKRLAKDFGTENLTEPGSARPVEEFSRAGNRQSSENLSADMAMDAAKAARNPGYAGFRQRFPNAARVQRF